MVPESHEWSHLYKSNFGMNRQYKMTVTTVHLLRGLRVSYWKEESRLMIESDCWNSVLVGKVHVCLRATAIIFRTTNRYAHVFQQFLFQLYWCLVQGRCLLSARSSYSICHRYEDLYKYFYALTVSLRRGWLTGKHWHQLGATPFQKYDCIQASQGYVRYPGPIMSKMEAGFSNGSL